MKILHNVDFHLDVKSQIKDYLKQKNIETSQNGIHFGNCCLVNIPDDLIEEIKRFPVQYRNKKTIIEKEDLLQYREGDKVIIHYLETDFFPVHGQRGTVYKNNLEKGMLIIRAYRSRTRGYYIYPGDNANISKGWKK